MRTLWRNWPSINFWRTSFFYLFTIGVPFAIFSWHLGSQTVGLSTAEVSARTGAKLINIFHNPLFAPYKILENILFRLSGGHIFALRLTSVIFSLAILVMFFYVLKIWFGKSIALLTVLLLALTPIYLVASRTATPIITYTLPIAFLFAYQMLKRNEENRFYWALLVVILALSFYIPGLIWIYLISSLFWGRNLFGIIKDNTLALNLGLGALFVILLSPLIYSFVINSDLLKSWLLIPGSWPQPQAFARDLAWTFSDLFIRLRAVDSLSVGRLALLNAVQIGLFIFGTYVMWVRLRKQFFWLNSCLLIIIILSALNHRLAILMMALPMIAFICGMGLRYLFVEWRQVFPKNPLAKGFAIFMMFGIISIHILYGIRYSLLAWPTTTEVRQSYVLK